jgi:hypothetical protein
VRVEEAHQVGAARGVAALARLEDLVLAERRTCRRRRRGGHRAGVPGRHARQEVLACNGETRA